MAENRDRPGPSDEKGRPRVLTGYALVDNPSAPEFNRLVALAARLFGTPVALVTLINHDRQIFYSRFGTDGRASAALRGSRPSAPPRVPGTWFSPTAACR